MNIKLYQTSAPNNQLTKSLTEVLDLTGTLRDECDVINPVIKIECPNPTQYNYAYIPEFNRYYFITDITSIRKDLWEINLAVDVLMSFNLAIKSQAIISKRSSAHRTQYEFDDKITTFAPKRVRVRTFDDTFVNQRLLLTVAGGD